MVVLEAGGMLSSSSNQYIQPDYLSSLPATLDAKKSPLALLAQTCSQIGADTPPSKPEKSKKTSVTDNVLTSPSLGKEKYEKTSQSLLPTETKLVFKPYEDNVVSRKIEENRSSSKCPNSVDEKKSEPQSPGRKTSSPATNYSATPNSETSKNTSEGKSITPAASTSPIIRAGIEILQGHSKDVHLGTYKTGASGLPSNFHGHLNSLCCLPGAEHANPAFRPPFPGVPYNTTQQTGIFTTGYVSTSPGAYLNYVRVKTPSGGEALVPMCKDPYCTGCQFSIQNQQLLVSGASGPCPSGCSQCDHQKYNLAMAMSLVPPSSVPSSSLVYSPLGRPYICNWITSDTYCGKRFITSEELLQHLRTHTNGSDSTSSTSSLLSPHSLFSSTFNRSSYPNPPLSPLSTRYHPYGKPTLPTSLVPSPYSAFNPTTLGPYYSVYSVYGRLGAAAVHP